MRSKRILAQLFVLLSVCHTYGQQQSLTLTGSQIVDAFVKNGDGQSGSNYGTNTRVRIGSWDTNGNNVTFRTLMYFNLSAIPANATVHNAILTLKSDPSYSANIDKNVSIAPASNEMHIQRLNAGFNEATVNWNNKPASSAVDHAYVSPSASEHETLVITDNVQFNAIIQGFVNSPSTNYGILLRQVNEVKKAIRNYGSSESNYKPVLEIIYTLPVASFPYNESFENTSNAWVNGVSDDGDWTVGTGSTPNSNTGPSAASQGAKYQYVNTSITGSSTIDRFLVSPGFVFPQNTSMNILFDYHMFGANMGTLQLEASLDRTNWTPIWSKSGDQPNQWHTAEVVLGSAWLNKPLVYFRFKGTQPSTTSTTRTSDMAVDNIRIQVSPPPTPTAGTNGSRVGPGSVTLIVNAVTGATAYKWYSAPSGSTPIATTTTGTYQTTSLNYTTPYYVSASNSTGESVSRYPMLATIKPVVTFQGATVLTMGQSVTLQAPAGYDSHAWKNAQASTIGEAPTVIISTAGTYTLEATKNGLTTTSDPIAVELGLTGQNRNYIVTSVMKVEGVESAADVENLTIDQRSQQVQYFDGLGRPIQTVVTMGSPNKQDIVQPIVYDAFGRQAVSYLPYVAGSDGLFKDNFIDKTNANYTNNTVAGLSPHYQFYQNTLKVAHDIRPYAETVFEASPLNRVMEQAAPGASWSVSSGRTVKMDYEINGANEVRLWELDANGNPTTPDFYAAGQLYKNRTTDEDDNEMLTYTDKRGQTILKSVQVDATTWANTYYVYDTYGNLRAVLPSELSKNAPLTNTAWTPTPTEMDNWAFTYIYDGRNRMVEKKVPGAEKVIMVYDKWDRLVLTQDGNQRGVVTIDNSDTDDKWLFTKYDALNRPILTGLIADANKTLKSSVENGSVRFDTYDVSGSHMFGYAQTSHPIVTEADVLTVTYYDKYTFQTDFSSESEWTTAYDPTLTSNTKVKGLVTGSLTRQLGAGMLKTISYYDSRYRLLEMITENHLGGTDRTTTTYANLVSSNVMSTTRIHTTPVGGTQTITDAFTYDHADRLLTTTTTINGQSSTSTLEYNELGQLVDKELGTAVQEISYDYNIRGWLTKINGGDALDTPTDIFGMELQYDLAGKYNGNIGKINWKNLGGAELGANASTQTYHYTYDKLNRLKTATYEGTNMNAFNESGNDNGIGYDLNGNIKSLHRNQLISGTVQQIDQLTYEYGSKGNQLQSVADNASDPTAKTYGFNDGNTGVDYTYDENGNMTKDLNKGISSITYNHLNLPKVVTMTDATITYTYDAAGIKLRKAVTPTSGSPEITDYVGGIHYTDNALTFIQTADGRYVLGDGFEYHLTDHLGNTRATVNAAGEVVQRDDYYPFGLTFNSFMRNYSEPQRYKYNGKEEQEEWGVIDYGWRMYQADIGRWFMVDPLADSNWMYSPYNYVENNPLIYIDPDGLDNYYIYGDGSIYVIRNDDTSNSYTYFSNDGNTHEIGTFDKNENGLVSLGTSFSYDDNGLSIGYTVKSKTAEKGANYISGDAMASFIGALSDNNTTDAFVTNASNSDGTSPSPSKSHVDGSALDLRYFSNDRSSSAINIWSRNLDWDRQNAFNQSLTKFGYTKLLSEHYSTHPVWGVPGNPDYKTATLNHRLNLTNHYRRGNVRHHDHMHVGGKWDGKIQYAPSLTEIKH